MRRFLFAQIVSYVFILVLQHGAGAFLVSAFFPQLSVTAQRCLPVGSDVAHSFCLEPPVASHALILQEIQKSKQMFSLPYSFAYKEERDRQFLTVPRVAPRPLRVSVPQKLAPSASDPDPFLS
jgi:hypothetical protein